MDYKCPKCGETENLHYNYDYSKQHRPILNAVCNECGNLIGVEFKPELTVDEILDLMAKQNQEMGLYDDFPTKPGFVERRMKLGKEANDKNWNEIYSEYSTEQYPPFGGPFTNALSFIEWLKQNYIAPEKIIEI